MQGGLGGGMGGAASAKMEKARVTVAHARGRDAFERLARDRLAGHRVRRLEAEVVQVAPRVDRRVHTT